MKNKGIVAVVDDDRAVLQSLESLLESVGYIVRLFASAEALLASDSVSLTICVISDIGMPGMNGIALKALLPAAVPGFACDSHHWKSGTGAASGTQRTGTSEFL